ncbi:hypothetical protein NMY22_g2854 [Coprinellus aureogranulatus]|nr:hypothetical protein NMY22_g2854 [Coprinellus aureogranulatus]
MSLHPITAMPRPVVSSIGSSRLGGHRLAKPYSKAPLSRINEGTLRWQFPAAVYNPRSLSVLPAGLAFRLLTAYRRLNAMGKVMSRLCSLLPP